MGCCFNEDTKDHFLNTHNINSNISIKVSNLRYNIAQTLLDAEIVKRNSLFEEHTPSKNV